MQVHGHPVDKWNARFSGKIEEVDEDDFKFDRVVMMLVAVRTSIGNVDPNDAGEVVGLIKLKIQDAVPLTGELRDQAIAFLAHGGNQGYFDLGNHKHPDPDVPPLPIDSNGEITKPKVASYAQVADDDEDVESPAPVDETPETASSDDIFVVPVARDEGSLSGTVVVGHIADGRHGAPSGGGGEGPGVGKFDAAAFGGGEAPTPGVERVGSVYGHQRKDALLQGFLDDDGTDT